MHVTCGSLPAQFGPGGSELCEGRPLCMGDRLATPLPALCQPWDPAEEGAQIRQGLRQGPAS